jgi:surface protein
MQAMFADSVSFQSNLSAWNVSKVQSMGSMFRGAVQFNSDISSWDVSSVQNLTTMFFSALSFNQSLCPWQHRLSPNVTTRSMFAGSACPDTTAPVWDPVDLAYSGLSWCQPCSNFND